MRRERKRIVRKLAPYLQRTDPDCFVADPGQFPQPDPPQPLFLSAEQQILALLDQAAQLPATAAYPLHALV